MSAKTMLPVEFLTTTRLGEKGELTVPSEYRSELQLETGAQVAVLRLGAGLLLIPEQAHFRRLCDRFSFMLLNELDDALEMEQADSFNFAGLADGRRADVALGCPFVKFGAGGSVPETDPETDPFLDRPLFDRIECI